MQFWQASRKRFKRSSVFAPSGTPANVTCQVCATCTDTVPFSTTARDVAESSRRQWWLHLRLCAGCPLGLMLKASGGADGDGDGGGSGEGGTAENAAASAGTVARAESVEGAEGRSPQSCTDCSRSRLESIASFPVLQRMLESLDCAHGRRFRHDGRHIVCCGQARGTVKRGRFTNAKRGARPCETDQLAGACGCSLSGSE